ncbi:MAG: hypothetical protein RMK18_10065 [Armatimonadota bacterium]|nr:hypothetical protein [Armatimonadota bacterium]MCX7777757.1 hypothetical protein [Armatimonadota bacterium]MDW8026189.1 hypothetical protein [Armatimonadota bacterium]
MKSTQQQSVKAKKPERWRCQKCNRIVTARPIESPRCPHCGENLRKCRYCKWADTRMWECTNFTMVSMYGDETGRLRIPEPEFSRRCPFYESRLKVGFPLKPIHIASIMAALIFLIALVYGAYIRPQLKVMEVGDIWANLQVPQAARFLTPFYIRIDLRNLHHSLHSGDIVLRVEGEIIQNCDFVSAYPPPLRTTKSKAAVHCFYSPIQPGSWLIAELGFRPLHTGEFGGKLVIFQGGRRTYNLSLKVNVAP